MWTFAFPDDTITSVCGIGQGPVASVALACKVLQRRLRRHPPVGGQATILKESSFFADGF
jgi:hypothetical protein